MGPRLKATLIITGLIAVLVGGALFSINYTIVHDPHAMVADARLVWTGGSKPMTQVPLVGFVVHVDGDAGVQVTCHDGTVAQGGYVTGLMADDFTVSDNCVIKA